MGYGYYYDPTYILVVIGFIITLIAEIGVKGSYGKYKRINASKMITGREVARRILDANGLVTTHLNSKGEPIDTLPIFYTRKIKDRSRVSTDFSRSMMVYLSAS